MATPKMSERLREEMTAAIAAWRKPTGIEMPEYLRLRNLIPTSDCANVAVVTWGLLYHTGIQPTAIMPSRGHSYRIYAQHGTYEAIAKLPNSTDHRSVQLERIYR